MKSQIILSTLLLAGILAGVISCSKEDSQNNTMEITSITPSSPAELSFGEYVMIRYNYQIDNQDGARMWVQPYTNGKKTPDFIYTSSKVFNGIGSRDVKVSVKDGDQPILVDQLRIFMSTPDQEKALHESFVEVKFTFRK